jgi:DUF4097 and DUF4098 domain-containing protein YvlB
MTGSRILLLVGILGGGAAVETAYQLREHLGVGPFGWRVFGGKFYGPHFAFETRAERALPDGMAVSVENEFGDIDVKAGEAGKAAVVLRKDVYIADADKARAFADRIQLRLEEVDGRLRIATNRDELEREGGYAVGFETHVDVQLPAGTAVALEGAHGRARVEDAGDTQVENSYGDVLARRVAAARLRVSHGHASLEQARGPASLEVRHGDASVKDVPAAVSVTSAHGSVNAERTGALSVEMKYGELKAEAVAGSLQLRGEHAGVEARHVAGRVDVESSYSDAKIEDVEAEARVAIEHGAVRLARIKGAVVARSSYDDTTLEDIEGRAEVDVSHGGVRGRGLRAGVAVRTDGDDIVLEGFRGDVVAEAERGGIRLVPDGPLVSPVKASASFGNVRLRVPAGSRFVLDARADPGDLRVSVPGLVLDEQSEERVAGRVGEGGPRVELSSRHGDVRVSESPAASASADDEDE